MADAHAQQHHPYHLVDPSPWPIIGAFFVLCLALGGITFMNGSRGNEVLFLSSGAAKTVGTYLIGAAFLGVLYVLASWWVDVVKEAEYEGHHTRVVQLGLRYGMILFICSEVMFFVAWFWPYFDAHLFADEAIQFARVQFTGGLWPPKNTVVIDPWRFPLLNTLILLTSGTTVTWAHHGLLHGDRSVLKKGLALTIALGMCFTAVQAYEYSHAPFPFAGSIYGSTFFMATGFHGFHVIIGTVFLMVALGRALAGQFSPKQHLGFEFAAWYWHFVDVVWLFLFSCIYVWGSFGGMIEN